MQVVERTEAERTEAAREARLRRLATRQGLRLEKSRREIDGGTFQLVDPFRNFLVAWGDHSRGYGMGLDEIERELSEEAEAE